MYKVGEDEEVLNFNRGVWGYVSCSLEQKIGGAAIGVILEALRVDFLPVLAYHYRNIFLKDRSMEKKYQEGWQCFLDLCLETKDLKHLAPLFDLLLTEEEKESLAMRCMIIKELLSRDKTQRQIAVDLNVSIAKITRGSNELKRVKASFLDYVKKKLK